ncbi:MAG: amidase [Bauldia sp.]|uniref:amidase n=1 Tax=Bauldia sp. TaxID=2575872 RepID=UPI001DD67357|nr:amidase [Bauldia sp.]MCB1496542.1 amidase [Bauldia sp.]
MLIPSDPVNAFVDYDDTPVPNAGDGPLAGLTFAVKDIFDVAGYPTGCGNLERRAEGGVASEDAPAVKVLLDAGARFVGKTHTAELAFSLDGTNTHYGTPINPAAPDRVPGGSSSGSASAVAAGLADIALGSDTGGSVRAPASFCGIVGLRTSFGRVAIDKVMPLAESLDTVGWFTRDIDLYDRVGAVMLGDDVAGPDLTRMMAAGDILTCVMSPAALPAVQPFVDRLAAIYGQPETVTLAEEGLTEWQRVFRTVQGYEAWRYHGPWIEERKPRLMDAVRGRFEAASRVSASDYQAATAERGRIRDRMLDILGDDGFLVWPTLPTIAPLVRSSEAELETFRARALSMLCTAGLAGLPQISLPVATIDGAPYGLSLVGPPGRDRALIALGRKAMGSG